MKLHEHSVVHDLAGGAAIGHLAHEGDEKRYQLITSKYSAKMKDCSFSFGGMLSQIQRVIEKEGIHCGMNFFLSYYNNIITSDIYSGSSSVDEQKLRDFAACIQSSVVRHIETRVHRAILFCDAVQKPQWKRTLVCQKDKNVCLILYQYIYCRFCLVVFQVIYIFVNVSTICVLILELNLFVHHLNCVLIMAL
jgi:hypothetical protein